MDINYTPINNTIGDEIFTDGIVTWNITKLIDYLANSKNYLYRLNKSQYEILIRNDQTVNESKIDLVDLNKPIIVVERHKGTQILIAIDGIHRLRKAQKYNHEYILAHILPFEEHIKFLESKRDFNFMIDELNYELGQMDH